MYKIIIYYNGSILKYNYEYKYNSSGDILEKIEYNISDEIISKEVYNYSTTNSSQLLSINKVNTNNEIIETKTITYLEEDPFRPATYKNNNLTWNGKRLTSYGTNTYKYNSEGIRISKTTSEGEYKYLLDGNKIIKEIKPTNKEVYYHYDEKEELVGFNYNTKEYFYIRDITGNITNIIDSNGTIKVSYEYDAWGKVINIDGDEDLIEINSYLYKGYYYDKETSLYYCNSRYYDPEIRRWISIDDSSYLDVKSMSGVNLYCYCGNNPVMGHDPNGTWNWKKFWQGVATTVAIVIVVAAVAVSCGASMGAVVSYAVAAGIGGLAGATYRAAAQDSHYNRNQYNVDLPIDEADAIAQGWEQEIASYHQNNLLDGENIKYISPDGHREVVFYSDRKTINNTDEDMGTYNFASPKDNPVGHFFVDVLPYWFWGNNENDKTSLWHRLFGR